MADPTFSDNLQRMVLANLYVANLISASRDLFGKGNFSLSETERRSVDQAVWATVSPIYQWAASSEALIPNEQNRQPPGFVHHPKT